MYVQTDFVIDCSWKIFNGFRTNGKSNFCAVFISKFYQIRAADFYTIDSFFGKNHFSVADKAELGMTNNDNVHRFQTFLYFLSNLKAETAAGILTYTFNPVQCFIPHLGFSAAFDKPGKHRFILAGYFGYVVVFFRVVSGIGTEFGIAAAIK